MRKYAIRRARKDEVREANFDDRHEGFSPYYVYRTGKPPFTKYGFSFAVHLRDAKLFDTVADAATAIRLDGMERGSSSCSSYYSPLTIVPVEVEVREKRREIEEEI